MKAMMLFNANKHINNTETPFYITLLCLLILTITSCISTPVAQIGDFTEASQIEEAIPLPQKNSGIQNQDTPSNIEFIGFKPNLTLLAVSSEISKNDSFLAEFLGGSENTNISYFSDYNYWERIRDTKIISSFSQTLSEYNLAEDKTELYFGDYTPQDLAVYKGDKRYVAFVDVQETRFNYHDTAKTLKTWTGAGNALLIGGAMGSLSLLDNFPPANREETVGAILSGAGLLAGLLCHIADFCTPKTTFMFSGRYAVCLYDTQEHCLVLKQPVSVEWTEQWEGSIESDETDQMLIKNYCAAQVEKALLESFAAIKNKLLK
jgi:hypothetical protein